MKGKSSVPQVLEERIKLNEVIYETLLLAGHYFQRPVIVCVFHSAFVVFITYKYAEWLVARGSSPSLVSTYTEYIQEIRNIRAKSCSLSGNTLQLVLHISLSTSKSSHFEVSGTLPTPSRYGAHDRRHAAASDGLA